MEDRKVKGKPVIYVPVGETFTASDGHRYQAEPDMKTLEPCPRCDFRLGDGLCGRYRCIADDREDGVGVHFVRVRWVRVKEENQKQ